MRFEENITLPEKPSEELAEETGLHIGDGTMNFYKNGNKNRGSYALRGHIIDDKEHYNKIIKSLYYQIYGLNISLRDMPKDGVYGFQKWSDSLVTFKHNILGLTLGKKLNISIPKIFTLKEELVTSVIRGVFDTDGSIYLEPKRGKLYPRIEISTISKKLGYQLNILINRLGLRSTIYLELVKNPNWNNKYKINIRGKEMLNRWMQIINPHNPKHIKKFEFYVNNS
ncbi:MAG: LAGLIDADG family homing endonuclease [Nanoarchaeota archaeon]